MARPSTRPVPSLHLDVGADAFRHELVGAGLPSDRIRFELFEAGHGGIDYRYPLALAWLAEQIDPASPDR